MRVSGLKARDLINGMVTNDVGGLATGQGMYAAALTPKGKIVADLRIFAFADFLLIDTGAASAAGWKDLVRKYVNPRLAPHEDVSAATFDLGVFGLRARAAVSRATSADDGVLAALDAYASLPSPGEPSQTIARVPDLECDGFEIFGPVESAGAIRAAVLLAGAAEGTAESWETARVKRGWPRWGADMDDTTLPQEANLDDLHAISYTKGCYTGQEVVARIHFRGHVNRHLARLAFDAGDVLPPSGASILGEDGMVVGDVRSVASSPATGGIGIGMVRREVAPGSTLVVKWEGGSSRVTIEGEKKGATA